MKVLMLASALAAGLLSTSALAAPVSPNSGTNVVTGPANWTDIVNASGIGLVVNDARIISTNQGDAYDAAMNIVVNGAGYMPGTADLTGTTYTGGVQTMSGAGVLLQYYFSPSSPVARSFASFANTTNGDLTLTVQWRNNLGSDSGTQIRGTSSGDNIFGTNDAWIVTDDGSTTGSDPANGFVLFGTQGSPLRTPSAISTTTFSSAGSEGVVADFTFTIPANETYSLLFFNLLATTSDAALGSIADLAAITADNALLAGLSEAQLAQVINFDFGPRQPGQVPAPAAFGLFGLGLAGLGALRRKRAA